MTQVTPPRGTATVVLGDVAGSTRLWQEAPAAMAVASRRIAQLLDELVGTYGGHRPRRVRATTSWRRSRRPRTQLRSPWPSTVP